MNEKDRENLRRIKGFTKKSLHLLWKGDRLWSAHLEEPSKKEKEEFRYEIYG